MGISKKRSIMNSFILWQFSCCPLMWMFHNRKLNHRINKIHKIVYNDHHCTFEELLERDNSFTIHERNLLKLAIKMFKVNNELSIQIVSEDFHFVEYHYNFRHNQEQNFRIRCFIYFKLLLVLEFILISFFITFNFVFNVNIK